MALPTFVAAGAMAESGTTDIVPALPAGLASDDIMFLFVETDPGVIPATPAGWALVFGTPLSGSGSTLTVFWKRAGGSESSPTVVFGSNHISGHIEAYRGCPTTGNPWSHAYSGIKNTASTTMTALGSGAPVADSLVIVAAAMGEDITGGRASSPTNGDLANIAERYDSFTQLGTGGGVAVVTGEKATVGAFGATTWTWVNSVADVWLVIVLMPVGATNPVPQLVGVGSVDSSATIDIVPGLPVGWAENDIFVLVCETAATAPATPSGGWAVMGDSPQTSLTGNDTTISAFWKRATSSESAPTVLIGAQNHVIGTIFAIRNCVLTGDPWDVTSGGVEDTANTTLSATGDTSTVDNVMVCILAANGSDTASAQYSNWANTVSGVVEILDNFTSVGHGGGFAVAIGWKIGAGAYGTTTATLVSSAADAYLTGALKPFIAPVGGGARSQAVVIG